MDKSTAMDYLEDGHTIITPSCAREVCSALGVPFDEHLVRRRYSDTSGDPKGLTMKAGMEGSEGVYTLHLSYHVVKELGIEPAPGADFIGRGFQAQANAGAVARKLAIG